jgi:hypothetical protein
VDSNWSGSATVSLPGFTLQDAGSDVGTPHLTEFASSAVKFGTIDSENSYSFAAGTATKYKAINLFLESGTHGNPKMAGHLGHVVAMGAQVYDKDGKAIGWYLTAEEAADVCAKIEGDQSVKVWVDHASTIKSDVYMDLNGYNMTKLTLNDGVKLYAFDSKAAAGEAGASINVAAQPYTQINGKTYVVNDGRVYPVELKIASVSLRLGADASSASMYYTASIKAAAEAGIKNFGVAVTVDPEAAKLTEDYLYTQVENETPNGEYYGVLVQNIAANDKTGKNAGNAATPIYAKAYVTLEDGTELFSNPVNKTLAQVVEAVEAKTDLTPDQTIVVNAMTGSDWYKEIKGIED